MRKGRLVVASSERCSDIYYASGFHCPDPFIWFSVGREKGIIVSTLEFQRAQNETKNGVRVYNNNNFAPSGKPNPEKSEILAELSRRYKVELWETPGDFPLQYAESLLQAGVKAKCAKGEFFPGRCKKNKTEIEHIRKAQSLTQQTMQKVADALSATDVDNEGLLILNRKILTSEMLRQEVEIELKKMGCTASRTIIACGVQGAEPHNQGTGPLRAKETIIVDIFPRCDSNGYWGDMTRTFVKGKAPARIKRAFEAVFEAKEKAREMAKAGVPASKLHELAFKMLEQRKFPTGSKGERHFGFIHGLGHGVGLDIHESPRVSPLNSAFLEAGNVVTIEPGLYYPEWGGIRIEDLVVIKEDGCEPLNDPGAFLEIL